jgi:hypothetical protein
MNERNDTLENSVFEDFELQLNQSAKDFLKEAAKWAYFLSILGFVGMGILVLLALFMSTVFSSLGSMPNGIGVLGGMGWMISAFYIAMAAVYFFPIYYLNKFASHAKLALRDNDSESLTASFEYLKSHYKFFGILALVFLVFYALVIVFAIIAAVAR